MSTAEDDHINVADFFEALVQFPEIIRAMSTSHILFEDEDSNDGSGDESEDMMPIPTRAIGNNQHQQSETKELSPRFVCVVVVKDQSMIG